MKYNFIIFDFDGTLADTYPLVVNIINEAAGQYGFNKITNSGSELTRGYDINKLLRHLDIPLWKWPLIENHLKKLMAANIHLVTLFKDIDNLLRQLSKNGVTLAIITSNTYENVNQILGPEITVLIDFYECNVPTFNKPHKLKQVLKKGGFRHNEAIYIGDEIRDCEAAQKNNIAFGAVSWGYNSLAILKKYSPTAVFESVQEMTEKLLG